jgi:hypothetical protein
VHSFLSAQSRRLSSIPGSSQTLRQQLRDARFSEIDEIVLGGKGTSPIEAAKRIKTDAEMDGWIPGPLQPHVLCPLSNDEVFQLYASQGAISPEEEVQLSVQQPAVEKLVSPADFRLLVQEKDGASKRSQSHRKDLWDNRPGKEHPSTHLQQLHQRVAATALFLGEPQNWLREVLFAGWTGGGHAQAWEDLIRLIDSLTAAAGDTETLVMAYGCVVGGRGATFTATRHIMAESGPRLWRAGTAPLSLKQVCRHPRAGRDACTRSPAGDRHHVPSHQDVWTTFVQPPKRDQTLTVSVDLEVRSQQHQQL